MTNPDDKYLDEWKENFEEPNTSKSVVYLTVYDKSGAVFLTLSNKDLLSFSLTQDASYLVEDLPSYEIKFEVDNTDGSYDIDNPSGIYEKLTERNRVEVKLGYILGGEEVLISGGTYYLSSWNISSNNISASFTANDFLHFMTDKVDFTSLYDAYQGRTNFQLNGSSGVSLYMVLNDLLKDEGISYELDTRLNSIYTTYTFPKTAKNELIQLLAVAGQCSVYIDRETNTLHIMHIDLGEKTDEDVDYTIDGFNQFTYPEIALESSLDKLEVEYTSHYNTPLSSLSADTDIGGSGIAFNGSIADLKTGQPLYLTTTYDLGYITTANLDDWIKLSNSSVEIMSANIRDKTRFVITFASVAGTAIIFLPREEITTYSVSLGTGDEGNTITMSNEFITDEANANSALTWEYDYLTSRRVVDCSYRADPRLDALDFIGVEKKYGGVEGVLVEHIEYSYTGGMFRGSMSGRTIKAILVSTFATDSWSVIASRSESGTAERYYNVGDTKTIELTTGEEIELAILGFNHDDLADGSGKAGITIGMQDLMADTKQMNSSSTAAGGYATSLMKNTTLPEILATFPEDLQEVIKEVNKVSAEYSTSGVFDTTKDKLFLFSMAEIYSEEGIKNSSSSNVKSYADIYLKEGTQYEFFKNEVGDHDTNTACDNLIKHRTNSSSASSWWLRSPYVSYSNFFRYIYATGNGTYNTANSSYGVCLGFCI